MLGHYWHEIFRPDRRSTFFVRHDAAGQYPKTLDHHRADIAAIQLSDAVPEGIRDEFDTVRNLYLYSWYVYDFTVPATLYTHALIEKAVKEKCRRSSVPLHKIQGLRDLLNLSVARGWLVNSDFRFVLESTRMEIVPGVDESDSPSLHSAHSYQPSGTDYCERLAETLPKIRNMGAHGEAGLGFPASALHHIEICNCIINALFRTSDRAQS